MTLPAYGYCARCGHMFIKSPPLPAVSCRCGAMADDDGLACDARREKVPVVPVDDAAVERVASALTNMGVLSHREVAEIVLRAAGETP